MIALASPGRTAEQPEDNTRAVDLLPSDEHPRLLDSVWGPDVPHPKWMVLQLGAAGLEFPGTANDLG
jgi:hypothetical protein